MKETTRHKQIEKTILAGLMNLYNSQSDLDFNKFTLITLESLMLLEREEYLKSARGQADSGNGSYLRNFRSLCSNSLSISIPRSRHGIFKPMTLDLLNNQKEQVNELALLLYRKGLSTRDVSQVMDEFFGEKISKDSISNMAESFHQIRAAWENRELDAYYKVIYCDALYTSLKRGGTYSKEAVYVIYGIKDDNTRELLLLEVNPTESSHVWREYLVKLKKRGVEQIDLIVADGLTGFAEAAGIAYPCSKLQRCVVHLQRSILNKVRPKDREELAAGLKSAFNNFDSDSSKEKAMLKLQRFVERWSYSYKGLLGKLIDEEYIIDYLTYIDYPTAVRRMIYTTNGIENLNRQIRKVTKTKVTFENERRLLDLIFMVINDFEANNWQRYPLTAFQYWPEKLI
jgi:transposase-like protein